MPKRTGKPTPSDDVNQAAYRAVQALTGDTEPEETPSPPPAAPDSAPSPAPAPKNPAAVALGRLGGKKGGRNRMASLTPEERKALAKKAAAKRWDKKPED